MSESINPLDVTSGDAPRKERYEFLAALLKDSRSDLVDFMFKQAAVLTLMLGWIVSSKDAHEFIQTHRPIREAAVPAICSYFVLLAYWTWSYKKRSDSAYHHLLVLEFMPKEFYSSIHITPVMAVSLVSAHFVLCAVLIVALFQIG